MSSPDIHPENLLEKFTAGGLTANENNLLQEHLAGCAACRFELIVHSDLELEAETLDFDHVSTRQLLLALPQTSQPLPLSHAGPAATNSMPAAPVPSLRRVHRRRAIVLTAAALAICSGAAALVATQSSSSEPQTLSVVARSTPHRARPANRASAPRPAAQAAPEQAPTPAQLLQAEQTPKHSAKGPRAAATPSAEDDVGLTAAELFSNANQARRASDPARATRLYRLLQRKFPGSQEAQLSLVTLGSLQLNGGNAGAALATFNRYLGRGGRSLEAEALYGQAQALRQLGRRGEERSAWERLLARYPGSGYAPQARERLNSLGGS